MSGIVALCITQASPMREPNHPVHSVYLHDPGQIRHERRFGVESVLFKECNSTTHWPHCNVHRQGAPMRNEQVDPLDRKEPLEKPVLSDRLLQLAGVKAY